MVAHLPFSTDRLRRWGAAWAAAMVFALSVLAASPGLHADLHDDHASPDHDTSCAVTLFAQGVSLPVSMDLLLVAPHVWHEIEPVAAVEIFLSVPRYLRQPERGPPEC